MAGESAAKGDGPLEPPTLILSNGSYRTILSPFGGCSSWNDWQLTPWTEDSCEQQPGFRLFLRDRADFSLVVLAISRVGSPVSESSSRGETHGEWRPHSGNSAEFVGAALGLEIGILVTVSESGPLETRRVRICNRGDSPRQLDLTSAIELAMSKSAEHSAHPVFSRLFVRTQLDEAEGCLLAERRPRGESESARWVFHATDCANDARYETDRVRFIGRGQTRERPQSLRAHAELSGTVGFVLDPMLAIQVPLELASRTEQEVTFVLGAAESRKAALDACRAQVGIRNGSDGQRGSQSQTGFEARSGSEAEHFDAASKHSDPRTCASASRKLLLFDNGIGGFRADGREYQIRVRYDNDHGLELPPNPWINVVANERFGFLVSETGAGNTWSGNSRERRLTPWLNDPLLDPHGEALYLRDEDTGRFWSLWPGPRPEDGEYEIAHGFGYSRCRHSSESLVHETVLTIDPHDHMKIARVSLTNRGSTVRRLSVISYQRLVLGGTLETDAGTIETLHHAKHAVLLARNPASMTWGDGMAFAAALAPEGARTFLSDDRVSFLGRGGTPANPRFLREDGELNGRVGSGCDPAAILQIVLEIPAGDTGACGFVLGEAKNRAEAFACVRRSRAKHERDADFAIWEIPAVVSTTRAEPLVASKTDSPAPRFDADPVSFPVQSSPAFASPASSLESEHLSNADLGIHSWHWALDALQIETPSRELDVMVNGWLLYQTLSCRLWGRTALYQSGGAFGFRDQLQDASALLQIDPGIARQQILLHAAHQFPEGDVLHWWHPPHDRGIRTRFADDLLWLPLLTAHYIETTGDVAILEERTPFVTARLLVPGEDEALLDVERSENDADLYTHCCLAIDRSLATGWHGLPLFGTGDWNDGMNRVGREGRGESVWMGFFLYDVLGRFTETCRRRHDESRTQRYTEARRKLQEALHEYAWDGAWYLRGWYDNGAPLGSSRSDECRIDALVQAWAVLSKAAPRERAEQAMESAITHLVSEPDALIRLLAPPLQHTPNDPGYIKAYPPGIRENGGQYTHAALWFVRACAELGWTERAFRYLDLMNPIGHARTPADVLRYRVEPYVVAADVYGVDPHVGRGGWTWYTGSSGWMYRVAIESILGIRLENGETIRVQPCIPRDWNGFIVRWNPPGTKARYEIRVENRRSRDAARFGADEPTRAPASASLTVPALAAPASVSATPVSASKSTSAPMNGIQSERERGSGNRVIRAEVDGHPVPIDARGAAIPLEREGIHRAHVVVS